MDGERGWHRLNVYAGRCRKSRFRTRDLFLCCGERISSDQNVSRNREGVEFPDNKTPASADSEVGRRRLRIWLMLLPFHLSGSGLRFRHAYRDHRTRHSVRSAPLGSSGDSGGKTDGAFRSSSTTRRTSLDMDGTLVDSIEAEEYTMGAWPQTQGMLPQEFFDQSHVSSLWCWGGVKGGNSAPEAES